MNTPGLASDVSGLAPDLVAALHIANPWWAGAPLPPPPPMRRHLVAQVRRRMDAELAPIVVVRGPRQVGKTTVQQQIIADLLAEGVPPARIMRVRFDDLTLREDSLIRYSASPPGLSGALSKTISTRWRLRAKRRICFLTRCRTLTTGALSSSSWWTIMR